MENGKPKLILSLFPNVGLLDRPFEALGFCVIRGPDLLWGGDIRRFHAPADVFTGIIAGSPCQDFSAARRNLPPSGEGEKLLFEFARCVTEARPRWALLENVPHVPHLVIAGYETKRLDLSGAVAGGVTLRIRHFQFFHRPGEPWPQPNRRSRHKDRRKQYEPCAVASGGEQRNGSWANILRKQGLPDDFDLPAFTKREKFRAVGNGVSQHTGRMIAAAIAALPDPQQACYICYGQHLLDFCPFKPCACGCDRIVTPPRLTATVACRKRLERRRHDTGQKTLVYP